MPSLLQVARDRTSSGGSRGREEDIDDADYSPYFLVETTGQRIPLLQAIDMGWVFVDYDDHNEDALQQQVSTKFPTTVGAFSNK